MTFRTLFIICACLAAAVCVSADEPGIHSMLVGDKILELAETRSLTYGSDGQIIEAAISPDGKYVAYLSVSPDSRAIPRTYRLCLMKAAGGKPTVVMNSVEPSEDLYQWEGRPEKGEYWQFNPHIVWSPNSKTFGIPTCRITWHGEGLIPQDYLLIVGSNGKLESSIPFPDDADFSGYLLGNPGSRKFAASVRSFITSEKRFVDSIVIFDAVQGTCQVIQTQTDDRKTILCSIHGWSDDGQSLLCMTSSGQDFNLRKMWLDGRADSVVMDKVDIRAISPDCQLRMVEKPGINVENIVTGASVEVTKSDKLRYLCWLPNSRMLLFQQTEVITDEPGKRKRELNTLWLAGLESHKMNTMCVALDASSEPTWSADCMKMAYLHNGRLSVAELAWRAPQTTEKITAGLPLTEEEEKNILLNNAKMIGTAIHMYMADWDDNFPSGEDVQEHLKPYFKDKDVFFRPGTDQSVFTYLPPPDLAEGSIQNAAETIIGEMDSSYAWKVVLYADGHVKVVPK